MSTSYRVGAVVHQLFWEAEREQVDIQSPISIETKGVQVDDKPCFILEIIIIKLNDYKLLNRKNKAETKTTTPPNIYTPFSPVTHILFSQCHCKKILSLRIISKDFPKLLYRVTLKLMTEY